MALTQDDLVRLANNPVRGINTVVNELETAWFDRRINVNSKSHPFIFATDLILGSTYGFLNKVDDSISKLFPLHARNISDLSRHMSEEERFGIFGNPSNTTLQFLIEEQTYLNIAKDVTATLGKSSFTYKMLLIPKDTEVTLNGYTFAIENGVEIRYSEQTNYQMVYDSETSNPYSPISDNLLYRDRKEVNGKFYLMINIPARQIMCKPTENITSNESSGCRGEVIYQDYLYGVRAFLTAGGVTNEIRVTYDQDVFDPVSVTLALNLDTTNSKYTYEIPDVYIANGLGRGTVSIYTYSTKGELVKDFTDVALDAVKVNYQDYRFGAGKLNLYSAPIKDTGGVAWKAVTATSGGSNPLPFEQLKRTFIEGRRQRTLPITENNLIGTVENYGYNSVKSIDYLTGRKYSVTKELPRQENKKFYAPMSCFVGSYLASANDMASTGVVIDNGQRVTIPHNVLFDISTPSTKLVNQLTKDRYLAMPAEQIVDVVANNTLVYTPFYYVLDMTNSQAALRTYHLDRPLFNHQTFVSENSTLGLEVGVGQIDIQHMDDGYLITIVTQSGQSYKELENSNLGVQLSVQPLDSNAAAAMAATLYGETEDGERVWQFKLNSRFDVDINDVIYFTNFTQFGNVQPNTGVPLELNMTFIFTHAGDKEFTGTETDQKIDQSLFRTPMVGIIETQYSTTLGQKLGNLYSRIRPLVGEAQYKRYPQDVPERYNETKLKYVDGKLVIIDGVAQVEERAGDIMYTNTVPPQVILKYRANDVMYDDNGQPVILAPRDLKYHWDFIAFDGAYFFSKDDYDKDFALETKQFFVNVIGKDMAYFTEAALDQTSLVYQPRSKLGYQKVVVNSNYESYLRQDLSFVVTYYLTASGHKNLNLKAALTKATPKIINEALFNKTTIGVSDLTRYLKDDASAEVVAVKLNAMAGDSTVDVISNADNLTGFAVRKVLRQSGDGLVSVQEDIDVIFLPHDVSMVNLGPV